MTDVPSKHVWKIKESRIVFKDFDIVKSKYTRFLYSGAPLCYHHGQELKVFIVNNLQSRK